MFVNVQDVREIAGVQVTLATIRLAQHIIEAYVGRNESEVRSADDIALMAKAVAFQASYMKQDYAHVYEQVALVQMGQIDNTMTFDREMAAPFIAPLAVLTLRNLSWRRSRSVKTGSMFGRPRLVRWERD